MNALDSALEQLAPGSGWSSDWQNVLERAGATADRTRVPRRIVLALALVGAIVVPLAALADSNGWWFFAAAPVPKPTHAPVTVKSGTWGGQAWQLIAYPSATDGLCFAIVPMTSTPTGAGSGMDCAPVAGVPRTKATKASPDMAITYLSGFSRYLPAYIAGPVIPTASSVEVRLSDGTTLTTPTFAAPSPLQTVRFYATVLPKSSVHRRGTPVSWVRWIAGLASNGRVVACLAPATARNGISPLSACR